jgi:CRP/FNR family cyclic AMP-dependent transcriptional regulator
LLGLLESRDVVRTVEFGLRQQRVGLDAKVAELLELWLPPDLRPAIMPLFDRLTLREQAAAAERLGYLVQASVDDPLTALEALDDAHLLGAAMVSYATRFAERLPRVYDALRPMLPLFERMMFLRRVPLFAELSGEDLRGIAEIVDELDVEAGTTLCRKGEPGEEMYVVLSGRVSIRDGKTELAVLGEREIVGELAVLDHDARLADVVCIDDTRLLRLRGADLSELMARRPQISEQVLLVVVRRLRTVTQRLSQ